MWPAWWTLGVTGQWPSNGRDRHHGVLPREATRQRRLRHLHGLSGQVDSSTKSLALTRGELASQFHVWTMDWDEQNIVLSVDGQQLNTTSLASMLNADWEKPIQTESLLARESGDRRSERRRSVEDQLPQTLRDRLPARVSEAVVAPPEDARLANARCRIPPCIRDGWSVDCLPHRVAECRARYVYETMLIELSVGVIEPACRRIGRV